MMVIPTKMRCVFVERQDWPADGAIGQLPGSRKDFGKTVGIFEGVIYETGSCGKAGFSGPAPAQGREEAMVNLAVRYHIGACGRDTIEPQGQSIQIQPQPDVEA